MNSIKLTIAAVSLALAAGLEGCVVSTEPSPAPGPAQGTLSIAWTVAGSDHGSACDARDADGMDIDVYDAGDYLVASASPSCDAFVQDFDLPAGNYTAELTLVDAADHPVSTRLIIDARVSPDTETDVDADFPSSSFF